MATSFPSAELSNKNSQEGKVNLKETAKAHDENVLQKHVAFFDRNHDGIIYPWETYQGFRAIGCGILLSAFSAIFINLGLSRKTRSGKALSIWLPIEVKNIQKAKHGSDSGVYDSEGRFVPSKFEEIFTKHARKHPNALTSDELMGMLKANRVPKDHKGWLASYTEWKFCTFFAKMKMVYCIKKLFELFMMGVCLKEWKGTLRKEKSE